MQLSGNLQALSLEAMQKHKKQGCAWGSALTVTVPAPSCLSYLQVRLQEAELQLADCRKQLSDARLAAADAAAALADERAARVAAEDRDAGRQGLLDRLATLQVGILCT